jgi:hypothetical protein
MRQIYNTTEMMQALAQGIDEALNPDGNPKQVVKFSLLVWNQRDEGLIGQGKVNYVSNGDRATILSAFKEIVARWEKGDPTQIIS